MVQPIDFRKKLSAGIHTALTLFAVLAGCIFISLALGTLKEASAQSSVLINIEFNLYKDNNGSAGERIGNNTVHVGETFFVEITAEDTRSPSQGITGLCLDVVWDAAALEEIDDPFDPSPVDSPLLTSGFPGFRYGVLDETNTRAMIDELRGLSAGSHIGIGRGGPQRLSLLHFRADAESHGTITTKLGGCRAGLVDHFRSIRNSEVTYEAQTISVVSQSQSSPPVQMRFSVTDPAGQPISSIGVDQDFVLQAYIQDKRAITGGLTKAFVDVSYDHSLASATGPITHGLAYNFITAGSVDTPGLIDEAGGNATQFPAPYEGGQEYLLFSVPFEAKKVGTLTFIPDAADDIGNSIFLYGPLTEVDFDDVNVVGDLSIEIVQGTPPSANPWQNPNNRYDVNNDSRVNPLDGLFILDKLQNDGAGQLPALQPGEVPPAYYDVSGDGKITTLDVLFIFEFLV